MPISYIKPNEFDRRGTEMRYHNVMDRKRRSVGAITKVRPETVVIRDTKTGKIYGRRTLVQKSTESEQMPLLKSLLNMITEAGTDVTTLPEQVIGELQKLIRQGAKDVEQKWANALELTHKAYQVANVRRPAPDQKGAWKQYEELISFAVHQLHKARGVDGDWRMTSTAIREQVEKSKDPLDAPIGKRRFFVDIPGSGSAEVAGKSMDEIIDQLSNKFRRHGAKTRVAERGKKHAILSIWVKDVERDRFTVKEVS